MKIILASSSPRRAELLERLIDDFEIRPAEIVEELDPAASAPENAERLATAKARAAFEPGSLTLGFDTLGILDGWMFGKPQDKAAAVDFLKKLSGKTHRVISAFCAKTDEEEKVGSQISKVTFRELSAAEIEQYVKTNPVTTFAGAYAVQGPAKTFVQKIEGATDTVIGFPTAAIRELLGNLKLET
ncbi:MAG: Maf family protein [Patescibacteria group bacterium]